MQQHHVHNPKHAAQSNEPQSYLIRSLVTAAADAEGAVGALGKFEHPKAHSPSTNVAVTDGSDVMSSGRLSNRLCA